MRIAMSAAYAMSMAFVMGAFALWSCAADHTPSDAVGAPESGRAAEQNDSLIEGAIGASSPEERGRLLDQALPTGAGAELDCESAVALAAVTPEWSELNARRSLRLLQHASCEEAAHSVMDAAHGRWQARTGVTRGLAVTILADYRRRGVLEESVIVETLREIARESDSNLARYTAISELGDGYEADVQ